MMHGTTRTTKSLCKRSKDLFCVFVFSAMSIHGESFFSALRI